MENEDKNEVDGRIYEVGYLLVPVITEENLPAEYGNLKEMVSSMGGNIIADEMPRFIDLAYEMAKDVENKRSKFNTAYFGWIKFEMDPESLSKLKDSMTLSEKIIRFLIIKTVRENTIASRKPMDRRGEFMKKKPAGVKGDEAPAPEINKEEIDKQIDAMVVE